MLVANQQDINLGTLRFGVPHNFKYELQNTSAKTLNIVSLVPGCTSCTKATINQLVLAPNQKVDMDVVFTPGSTGVALKSISIVTEIDGVVQPETKVTFRANVSP